MYCRRPSCRCISPCDSYWRDQEEAAMLDLEQAARRTDDPEMERHWREMMDELDVSAGIIPSSPLTFDDLDKIPSMVEEA